ncbi:hypothetical protein, partial [Nonomuraea sp. NPDC049784]|uniref:hypothetical protein n=1 Tax=Nonomuraea sp. NPDC049784 TaxID=3154361 RepID=UPI0033C0D043
MAEVISSEIANVVVKAPIYNRPDQDGNGGAALRNRAAHAGRRHLPSAWVSWAGFSTRPPS